MTDRNLGLPISRSHRGVFFIGTGVLCAAAITLSGCSGPSNDDPFAGASHTQRLKVERDKLAKAQKAHKAMVRKLSAALQANKAKDRQLRAARTAASKYRAQIAAAHKKIADLETSLAKNEAPQANAADAQSTRQSEQLADSLKAKEKELLAVKQVAEKYRAELEAADKDVADLETRLAEATAAGSETEAAHSALKLSCEGAQQRAARLVKELEESHTERDKLNKQLQGSLAKVDAAVKQRTEAEQAAETEVKTLRDELALAKQQISKAEAAAASANPTSASGNECSSR